MSTIKFEPQQGGGGGGGGSDVDREYVDLRDQYTLDGAKDYTDTVAATKVSTTDYTANDKATLGRLNADFSTGSSIEASELGFTVTTSKLNPTTGNITTTTAAIPYASSENPGAMSVATFNAVTSNSTNIDAILSGAVSIDNLPASPTQSELTTAWQTATSLATVINGAKINDSTNQKVWTYYTNTTTWYPATNTAQVTVNTATNSSKGIVQGDGVNDGGVSVAADGTMSVNGWSTLATAVGNNTTAISNKADTSSLAAVATSGAYSDLSGKPTIPSVNNGQITITNNGTTVDSFTVNQSTSQTIALSAPVITMQTTDPGEGQPLAANNFIAVYQ